MIRRFANLVDYAGESSDALSTVPMGRRRFLAAAGAVIFGFTVKLVTPETAAAWSMFPCYGPRACTCCNMTGNLAGNCSSCEQYDNQRTSQTCVEPTTFQSGSCWRGCAGDHYVYYCCDFNDVLGSPTADCVCRCKTSITCDNIGTKGW